MSFVPGTRVDRYELVQAVASGGMGTVWLAQLTGKHGFEKKVAVKTIRPDLAASAEARTMFLDEARLAARIDHAHVAQVLDVGEQGDDVYLVLEWVDGASLENLCEGLAKRGEPPPLAELLRIVADACEGLQAAHDVRDEHGDLVGLVHRDVSPQNLLVTRAGITKVIDFGIAKARDRLSGETEAGLVRGKRAYMAPEQAYGLIVDRRADVWALGAVLFRALVGRPPYTDHASCTQPVAIPPELPQPVRDVLARALAHLPDDRYPTAADMQRALEDAQSAIPARASSLDVATRFAPLLRPTFEPPPNALLPTVPASEPAGATEPTARERGIARPDARPATRPDTAPEPSRVTPDAPPPARDRRLLRNLALVAAFGAAIAVGAVWRGPTTTSTPPPAPAPAPATPVAVTTADAGVATSQPDATAPTPKPPTQPSAVANLEALVRDGSFREAVAHLGDVPATERTAHWLDLAASAGAGLLASLGDGDDALTWIDKLDGDYPKLRASPAYARARADRGIPSLRACIVRAQDDERALDACLQRGLRFASASTSDRATALATIGLLEERYQPHVVLPILVRMFGGKADPALCADPRVSQAVLSGLHQAPDQPAAHDGVGLLERCWDPLGAAAKTEFDHESKHDAVHRNACAVFVAKGILSSLETALCAELR